MAVIATSLPASLALLLLVCSFVKADPEIYYARVGSDIGYRNDSFLYAQCQWRTGNCTVSVERVGTSDVQSCDLQLLGSSEWRTLIELRRFDDDTIATSWLTKSVYNDSIKPELHVGIIKMFNCSLSHHVEHSVSLNMQIIPTLYRNGFDIFVERNKTMCAGATSPSCRVSFDVEGRRIGDPVPFGVGLQITNVWPIAADTPEKGFFVNGYETLFKSDNNIGMKLVEPTGKVIDLLVDKESVTGYVITLYPAVSNAHEYFGMCWRSQSDEFRCRQFDAAGKVRLNVRKPALPTEETLVGAHNLAEGGMLIISEIKTPNHNAFRIRKIDATGILGRMREVSHRCYAPEPLLWMHIAETEGELIFYFSCWGPKKSERDLVDASVLRLPKKEFI